MSDKLESHKTALCALPGLHPVRLEGADALAFAQAQFTSDVAALADGHWQWSAWLTPKGRVIAIFALLRVHGERIDLVLLDTPPAQFVASLQRFVFRSKLRITAPPATVLGAMQAPAVASGNVLALQEDAIEIDFGADGLPRTLRIVALAEDAPPAPAGSGRRHRADL